MTRIGIVTILASAVIVWAGVYYLGWPIMVHFTDVIWQYHGW